MDKNKSISWAKIKPEDEALINLHFHIKDHESLGSYHFPNALGFAEMPPGYALMQDPDDLYWYWLSDDGTTGLNQRNRWRVYHEAKAHWRMKHGAKK